MPHYKRKNNKKELKLLIPWAKYQKINIDKMVFEGICEFIKEKHNAIAIITGKLSNITVIDIDNRQKPIKELQEIFGESKVIVETPRGYHLYYSYNGEKSNTAIEEGIDIRGDGGLIIAPPSTNYQGKGYKFIKGNIANLKI